MIQLVKRSISGDADAFLELMERILWQCTRWRGESWIMMRMPQMPCRIPYLPALKNTYTEKSGIFQNLDDPDPDQ